MADETIVYTCPVCGLGFKNKMMANICEERHPKTMLPSEWIFERFVTLSQTDNGSFSERQWRALMEYLNTYGVHPPVKE